MRMNGGFAAHKEISMLGRVLVVVGVMFAGSGAAMAQEVGAQEAKSEKELGVALDHEILAGQLGQFWGQVLVAKGGEIVLAKGYGLANESLRELDSRTLMDIGSIAKQFTAAAVLKLEMGGRLSTEDAVSKYFPSAGGVAERVTLHQLLTHTSGLSDGNGAIQALAFGDRDEAVRLAMNSRLNHEPGEEFEYCNGGYVVLAAVIEKAAGKKFEAYLREALFAPAGMTSTGFLDGEGLDLENAAARVVERGGGNGRRLKILQDGWGWGFKGCGGVLTNVHDMLAWDRALRGTKVLDEVSLLRMYNAGKGGYGMGWFVERTGGGRRVHHSGGTRGFTAEFSRDLEEDLVVVVLTNEHQNPVGMAEKLRAIARGERETAGAVIRGANAGLDAHGSAELIGVARCVVRAEGTGVKLSVVDGSKGDRVVVESVISRENAAMVAHELPIAIEWGAGKRTGEVAKGIDVCVATGVYTADAEGSFAVPGTAKWMPFPSYRGSAGEDPRPTLVLQDEEAGFWPVILKMHPGAAAELAAEIGRALGN